MMCEFNMGLLEVADQIASAHTKNRWFEGVSGALIRKIRLRQDIYNALCAQRSPSPSPAPNVVRESDGANTGVIDEYQVADPETGQWRLANPLDVMAFVERGWPVRVFLENCTLWNLVEDEMSIGRMPEPSAVPREISL